MLLQQMQPHAQKIMNKLQEYFSALKTIAIILPKDTQSALAEENKVSTLQMDSNLLHLRGSTTQRYVSSEIQPLIIINLQQ